MEFVIAFVALGLIIRLIVMINSGEFVPKRPCQAHTWRYDQHNQMYCLICGKRPRLEDSSD